MGGKKLERGLIFALGGRGRGCDGVIWSRAGIEREVEGWPQLTHAGPHLAR